MELQVERIISTSNKGRIGIIFKTKDKNLVELIFTERLLYEFFRNIEDIKIKLTQPFLPTMVTEGRLSRIMNWIFTNKKRPTVETAGL